MFVVQFIFLSLSPHISLSRLLPNNTVKDHSNSFLFLVDDVAYFVDPKKDNFVTILCPLVELTKPEDYQYQQQQPQYQYHHNHTMSSVVAYPELVNPSPMTYVLNSPIANAVLKNNSDMNVQDQMSRLQDENRTLQRRLHAKQVEHSRMLQRVDRIENELDTYKRFLTQINQSSADGEMTSNSHSKYQIFFQPRVCFCFALIVSHFGPRL